MNNPELSVVLPVFREGTHIKQSLSRLQGILQKVGTTWEIVVVDDGSDDNTWEVLLEARKHIPMLRLARFSRNFGKESALCAGLDLSRGSATIMMDGDLQHPPELIPEFVKLWKEGFLVVNGVKASRGEEGLFYGIAAKSFYRILSAATGLDFQRGSDFKLLDRRVIEAWKVLPERTLFFRGMVSWLGFPQKQIPFYVAPRTAGQSSFGLIKLVRLAWSAMSAYSAWPLHAITVVGLIFTAVSTILLLQTLVNKMMGTASTGFTTVISLQLLIGSVLILSIGVIGEYIAKIFEEVKGRPRYIVFESEDSDVVAPAAR
jgi:glycosyltransferase involved in cell wall biosynthesis